MSWSGTFAHGVAISVDYGAEMLVFWRIHAPMTLSSQAGLALRRGETRSASAILGRALNWMNPGHCEGAIAADIARANDALKALQL